MGIFTNASWSSFVPDLIVGVATGGLIGLALYVFERRSSRARRRAEARAVSQRIVHPLLIALKRPQLLKNYTTISPLARKASQSLELIEGSDVDQWHETMPTDLTTKLLHYRSTLWDLEADADNLNESILRWHEIHGHDERVMRYATAELLDAPHQYLHQEYPDDADRRALADQSARLLKDAKVKNYARKYRGALGRVDRAQTALVEVLIQEMQIRRSASRRGVPEDSTRGDKDTSRKE